jgi:hypothetical protein
MPMTQLALAAFAHERARQDAALNAALVQLERLEPTTPLHFPAGALQALEATFERACAPKTTASRTPLQLRA